MGHRARRVGARDEADVVRAVREARSSGHRLRTVGGGGSKSGVNAPPEVELRLRQPDRLLEVDGTRVTAPAGMTTGRLQALLGPRGLALPTVGEWKEGTLAGSLATGTHGGSARHGILATSVRRLRMVDGRGQAVELSPGDPDFRHAGVSLGALGVVTEVTLACEERFSLRLETDVVPFEEYLRDPVTQEARSEFHASVWVPWAGRVIRFAADRVGGVPHRAPGVGDPDPSPADADGRAGRRRSGTRSERPRGASRRERFGRRTALATFLSRRLGLHGAVSDRLFRRAVTGDCGEILSPLEVSSRKARFRNAANALRRREAAELAVPASRAGEALARFRDFFREESGPLNNPVGLRLTAADDFSLSPCSGRDTLWLDLFYDDVEPFVTRLGELAAELDARCHWGKALAVPPAALRRQYPAWDAFREARDRLDPDGVFANRYTDELGLTGSARDGHGGPAGAGETAP